MSLAPGTRIGPFEVTASLGEGGMGEVYRARDARLGRDVALKVLPTALAHDAERLARFEREARTLAALNHPHIAQVYGIEDSGARRALVMELVEGEDLAQRLARGPLPVDEALAAARQIAEALEAAHEAGIVHRDLKPANVRVRPDGMLKVLDFGLAKALDSPGHPASADLGNSPTITSPAAVTAQGIVLGTAAYMAPEQTRGRSVDKRADVWAFGCVVYEMLTARRAFGGDDVSETMASILRDTPDWERLPVDVPEPVRALLRGCLEKDRRARVGDLSVARFVLADRAATPTVTARSTAAAPPPLVTTPPSSSRTGLRLLVPVVLAAAGIAGVAYGVAARRPTTAVAIAPVLRFTVALPASAAQQVSRRTIAISPDGTRLVYVAGDGLRMRDLSRFTDDEIRVTGAGSTLSSPTFSPDGRWIAFYSSAPDSVKRVSIDGGAALRACDLAVSLGPAAANSLSWSPSGIYVGMGAQGVMRCDPNGGNLTQVAGVGPGEIAFGPQVLPDGRSLLFSVSRPVDGPARWDNATIVLQTMGTSERRTLVEGGNDVRYLPTGHLTFLRAGVLLATPFDAATGTVGGEPTPVVDGIRRLNGGTQADVSASGTLAYMPGPVGADANWLIAIGSRGDGLTPLPFPAAPYASVRVSPDGSRIAVATETRDQANISVAPADGRAALQRLTLQGRNRYPVWSPDGRWIAFQSDRGGDSGIYRQLADGTGPAERLTRAMNAEEHIPESWSPDGRTLAYSVRVMDGQVPRFTVTMLSLASRESTPSADTRSINPPGTTFSPDGRWIAYTLAPGSDVNAADRGVFLQPFPATGAVFQVPRQRVDFQAAWSPDGRELVFVSSGMAATMAAVPVSTGASVSFGAGRSFRATVTGERLSAEPRAWDVMPDGRYIGLARPTSGDALPNELRIVVNWFDELKRQKSR